MNTPQNENKPGLLSVIAAFPLVMVAIAPLLYGVMIFVYQVVFWASQSSWVRVSLLNLFMVPIDYVPSLRYGSWNLRNPLDLLPNWLQGSWEWIAYPDSWLGLHKITYWLLDFLPASLAFIVGGALWMVWLLNFTSELEAFLQKK